MRLAVDVSRGLEAAPSVGLGCEYAVDAYGCDPASLTSIETLAQLLNRVVAELGLQPLDQLWHTFPAPGGVTGLVLLSESHLTVHTFPECGVATFNLYCCRPKSEWPWAARLRESLGAAHVRVTSQRRG